MPTRFRMILCATVTAAALVGGAAHAQAADDTPPSYQRMDRGAPEESIERQELREERQHIRMQHESLEAQREALKSRCGDADTTPDCQQQIQSIRQQREALHERMRNFRERLTSAHRGREGGAEPGERRSRLRERLGQMRGSPDSRSSP